MTDFDFFYKNLPKKDEQIIGVIKLGFLMSKGQLEITIFEARLFIQKPLGNTTLSNVNVLFSVSVCLSISIIVNFIR